MFADRMSAALLLLEQIDRARTGKFIDPRLRLCGVSFISPDQSVRTLVEAWRRLPFRIDVADPRGGVFGAGLREGQAGCLPRRQFIGLSIDADGAAAAPVALCISIACPDGFGIGVGNYARIVDPRLAVCTVRRVQRATRAASPVGPLPAIRIASRHARLRGTVFALVPLGRATPLQLGS